MDRDALIRDLLRLVAAGRLDAGDVLPALVGLAGLRVDLASIVYKALAHAERTLRMTAVGSLVLAIGAVLIFGAIYFKTDRTECTARFDAWRRQFDAWE